MSVSNIEGTGFDSESSSREEIRKDCEAKYKAIFDSVNDAIFIHDPDTGAILEVNRKMTEMYGYTEDEARMINVGDISSGIPPYDQEGAMEKVRIANQQGGLLFEWHGKSKSGRLFWVEVNHTPTVISGNPRIIATVRDITKKKEAEQALEQNRKLLQDVIDGSPAVIFVKDLEGRFLTFNHKLEQLLGKTKEEMKGKTDDDVFPKEWAQYYQEHDRKVIDTGMPEQLEEEADLADGKHHTFLANKFPLYDTNGRPYGLCGISTDITERKQAGEKIRRINEELEQKVHDRTVSLSRVVAKLEEQRELLQTIMNNIPVIISLCNEKKELLLVNKEFERITGWSADEAGAEYAAAACFNPAYGKEVQNLVTKAEPGWREFEITTRSGNLLRITWATVDVSDGSHIGIGIDITERKKMEQDLLRLATAIEQAGEGIVLYNPGWVIEYVNPAYEKLSGYAKEELVGRDVRFIHSHVSGSIQSGLPYQAASRGEIWRGNFKRMMKSGEVIDEHLTVSPVRGEAGEVINYVAVVRDTTQEARLQQMVIQSQKMEAIGSLAGGIAHDLKNIFTPILINSEIAMEDMNRDDPAHPLLEEILHAARMGGDLVKQILTFARSTPGEKIQVDVSTLVSETLSLLRSTIPSTIDIRHHTNSAHPDVLADPTQIKQVLMNLGSNAAYAMKEHGGVLEVDVSCVDLNKDAAAGTSPDLASGSYVEIDVCDTGEGMDEDTRQHIFEPFFTTKKGEGTGLGLAVVQGIVKSHQGAVTVRSKQGYGSTFRIFLPELQRDQR